jgi:hypothetical protein
VYLARRAAGLQRGDIVGNDLGLIGEAALQGSDLVHPCNLRHNSGQGKHRDEDHTDQR